MAMLFFSTFCQVYFIVYIIISIIIIIKIANDGEDVTTEDSPFQTRAAATGNARSTMVEHRVIAVQQERLMLLISAVDESRCL